MSSMKEFGKTIWEVAKLTGIPQRKLKYFTERDIMRPSQKSESGYWLYSEKDIQVVQTISLLQNLGCSIQNIRDFLTAPFSRWQEDLEQQIHRLTKEKDGLENRLFLAEFLRYLDHMQISVDTFDINDYSSNYSEGTAWGQDAFRWKTGKRDSLCRFLYEQFSEAAPGGPLHELSALADRPPDDPAVQAQVRQLCAALWLHHALSPAHTLLMFRLIHTLSGMEPILNALLGRDGAVQFITEALQAYCMQL